MPHLTENRPALESWTDCPAGNRAHDPTRGPGLLRSGLVRLAHSLGQALFSRRLGSSHGRGSRLAPDASADPGLSGGELPAAGIDGRPRRTTDTRRLGRPLQVINTCQGCGVQFQESIRVRLCRACRMRQTKAFRGLSMLAKILLSVLLAALGLCAFLAFLIWAISHWGIG